MYIGYVFRDYHFHQFQYMSTLLPYFLLFGFSSYTLQMILQYTFGSWIDFLEYAIKLRLRLENFIFENGSLNFRSLRNVWKSIETRIRYLLRENP